MCQNRAHVRPKRTQRHLNLDPLNTNPQIEIEKSPFVEVLETIVLAIASISECLEKQQKKTLGYQLGFEPETFVKQHRALYPLSHGSCG